MLVVGVGCDKVVNKNDVVLSRVGDRTLTLSEARSGVVLSDLLKDSISAIQNYSESWERRAILSVEAEKLGLTSSPDIKRQLDLAKDQVLSDAMLTYMQSQLDTVKLTESDWRSFFDTNPVMVKVSESSLMLYHFYGSERDSMYALRDDMTRREQRESVLKRLKDVDLDWWNDQQMPKTVQALIREYPMLNTYWNSSTPMRISEVVNRNDLWHFFWVVGSVPVGTSIDTSLVRPYIEDWLLVHKKNRRLRALEQSIILNAHQTNLLQRQ